MYSQSKQHNFITQEIKYNIKEKKINITYWQYIFVVAYL